MKAITCMIAATCLSAAPTVLWSQAHHGDSSSGDAQENSAGTSASEADAGVSLEKVIAAVARKTGKRFLIDPRVHGHVQLLGQEISSITYPELLTILQVDGFAAVEDHYYIRVIPEGAVRQSDLPLDSGKQTYPDAQYVNRLIVLKSTSAAQLVPILRPLVPQQGQLAAFPQTNQLLISDTYANIKKLEALVHAIDAEAANRHEKCSPAKAGSDQEGM